MGRYCNNLFIILFLFADYFCTFEESFDVRHVPSLINQYDLPSRMTNIGLNITVVMVSIVGWAFLSINNQYNQITDYSSIK